MGNDIDQFQQGRDQQKEEGGAQLLVNVGGAVTAVDHVVAVAGVACESHNGAEEANDTRHDTDAKLCTV